MFGYVCSLQGSKAAAPSLMCVGGAGKGEWTQPCTAQTRISKYLFIYLVIIDIYISFTLEITVTTYLDKTVN